MKTIALIVAGGVGSRVGATLPKQFLPLAGRPMLLHTLEAFENCPQIGSIILLLPREWIDHFRSEILPPGVFTKLKKILPGGKTRQDSTYAGFQGIDEAVDVVLVHDGARPLIRKETIADCIANAAEHGAALAACLSKDTVKEVDGEGQVRKTLDRRQIYLAQTPQAARYSLLKEALETAYSQGLQATDEASLLEKIGVKVKIVETDSTNMKVTTPEDFWVAEAVLRGWEEVRSKG